MEPGGSAPSDAVSRIILHLVAIRSAVRIGVVLNEQFPSEETLTAFCNDEATIETLQAFVDIQQDMIRAATTDGIPTVADLATTIKQHHGRALEAVSDLAERIGVEPEDLFSFLLRAG